MLTNQNNHSIADELLWYHTDFNDWQNDMYSLFNSLYLQALYSLNYSGDILQDGQITLYGLTSELNDNLNLLWNRLSAYFPSAGDFYNGWQNFFKSFKDLSFQNVLLDVQEQINDSVNPVSENNKPQFDALVTSFKSDTAIGSMFELKDGMSTFFHSVTEVEPQASINVNTLPATFCGMIIPEYTIKIDLSWYSKYREQALYLWRFFLWVGYLFILWKRIPDIINGAGVLTDISNSDITSGAAESVSYSTTVDENGKIISMNERHTYQDIDGNKFSTTVRHRR